MATSKDEATRSLSAVVTATLSGGDGHRVSADSNVAAVRVDDLFRLWSGEISTGRRQDGSQYVYGFDDPHLGSLSEPRGFSYRSANVSFLRFTTEEPDTGAHTFTLELGGESNFLKSRNVFLLVEHNGGVERFLLVAGRTPRTGNIYRWDAPDGFGFTEGSKYRVMFGEKLPEVTIAPVSESVLEGQPVEFRVSVNKSPVNPLTATVQISGGGDYGVAEETRSVTFPAGSDASQTISIDTTDNDVIADDGVVTVTLTGVTGGLIGEPSAAMVTVIDDERTGVPWQATLRPARFGSSYGYHRHSTGSTGSLDPYQFSFDDVDYTVTRLSRGSNLGTLATDLTIILDSSEALNAADWQLLIGDPPVALDLAAATATRTNNATTYVFQNVLLPDWGQSVLIQLAEAKPVVSISAAADSITEGEAASFTLSADPAPDADLEVSVNISGDGFGVTGGDRTVTISEGETESPPFTVQTTADIASASLSSAVTATLPGAESYRVRPSAGVARVTVHDLERVWSGEITAGHRREGNQTLTGYAPTLGSLSQPRQFVYGSNTITVARISEELSDSGETFTLDLSGEGSSFNGRSFYLLVETSGGAQRFDLIAGATQAGVLYRWTSPTGLSFNDGNVYRVMLGEELPVVTIEAVHASVQEGQPVEFRVNIDKPPQGPVTARIQVGGASQYGVQDGTQSVSFPAGDDVAKILSLTTEDNAVVQPNATVTAQLDSATGATIGNPSSATIVLQDNDRRMAAPTIDHETRRSVLLTWPRVTGASGYDAQYRRQGETTWTEAFTNRHDMSVFVGSNGMGAIIDVPGLGIYEFQVRLRYDFGALGSGVGEWSPSATATLSESDEAGAVIWFATLKPGESNGQPAYGFGDVPGELTAPTISHFGGTATITGMRPTTGAGPALVDIHSDGGQRVAATNYRFYFDGIVSNWDNFPSDFEHSDTGARSSFQTGAVLPLRVVEARLPLAPTGLTVDAVRANRIDLSWTAPDNAGRPAISGYELRYRLQGSGDMGWFDGPGATGPSDRLQGLTPGQTYDVQVRANNIDGSSAWSDSVTTMTNTPPTASIAAGHPELVFSGETVELRGAGSDDQTAPADLTYQWTQTAGPTVAINNATSATASFVAPDVSADRQLIFRLTVRDELGDQGVADVTFTVVPGVAHAVWQTRLTVGGATEDRALEQVIDRGFRKRGDSSFGALSHESFTLQGTAYHVSSATFTQYVQGGIVNESDMTLRLSGSPTTDTCPTPLNGKWLLLIVHSDGSKVPARFQDDGAVGGTASCQDNTLVYGLLDMPELSWELGVHVTLALLPAPTVSIAPVADSVVEGQPARFRVAAHRPVAADLTVALNVAAEGDFGVSPGPRTVTIPAGQGSDVLDIGTTGDTTDEEHGSVTATLAERSAYDVAAAPGNSARVAVEDDDNPPLLQLWTATLTAEGNIRWDCGGTGFSTASGGHAGGSVSPNFFDFKGMRHTIKAFIECGGSVGDAELELVVTNPLPGTVSNYYAGVEGHRYQLSFQQTTVFGSEYIFRGRLHGINLGINDNQNTIGLYQAHVPPVFTEGESTTRSFYETEGVSVSATPLPVGDPVAATDENDQTLTYSLSGTHAPIFSVDSATGRLQTLPNNVYDYESGPTSYSVTITVDDGSGDVNANNQDSIDVTINLNNASEPPLAPAAPTVTEVQGQDDRLAVSWTAPTNARRPAITHYDLRYRELGSDGSWDFGAQDVSGLSATITGLTPRTHYDVQVRAANIDGDGPWSPVGRVHNDPPTASIAAAQATTAFSRDTVQLLGVGSDMQTDADDLTYLWTQTAGPAVAIQDATSATASFVAPDVNADTDLTFRVTVTDEVGDSSFAEVTIAVWKGIPGAVWNSRMTVGHTMRSESATVTFDTYGYQRGSRGSLTHQRVNYRGTHYVTGLQYDRQTSRTGIIFLNLEFILSRSATGNACATSFPRRDFYLVIANQDGTGSRALNLRDFQTSLCNTPNFLTVYEFPGHGVRWTDGQQLLVALVEVPRVSIARLGFPTVVEAGPARFRVSSHVAVPADLTVALNVAVEGDYGITPGPRTVTIPAGQTSVELSLPTDNDEIDEHNGSVTVTLAAMGNAYDVAAPPNNSVHTAIHDNDDPPGYLLWSATLNAQSHTRSTGTETGYFAAPGGRVGGLTPNGFVFREQAITVIGLSSRPPAGGGSSALTFELSHSLGAGKFVLQIGNEQYRFEGNGGTSHTFSNESISVGDGQTVTLHQLQTPPSFTDRSRPARRRNFDENVATQTRAAITLGNAFTATDANPQQTLTYTLSGTDADKFSLNSATGQLSTLPNRLYDYEAGQTSYALTLTVNDGSGASNDRQSIDVTIRLNDVAEPPLAPAAPTVTEVPGQDDHLAVSWTAPNNAGRPDITHYDLRYRALFSGDSGWTDGPQDVNGLTATITGLTAGTNYEVQVRAVNAEGDGAWSPAGRPFNNPPTASIAAGQATTAFEGETVQLLGVGSDTVTPANELTYLWTQTAGPTVTIQDANRATAGFTAPDVSADTNLTFRLTVTDEVGATAHADVTVAIWPGIAGSFWQARMTVGSQYVGGDNPFSRRGVYFTTFAGFGFGSLTDRFISYQGNRYLHWLFYRDDQTSLGAPQPDGPLTLRLSGHSEQEVLPGPWQGKLAFVSAGTDGSNPAVVRFNASGTNRRHNSLLEYQIPDHGLNWADGNTVLVALVQVPTISIEALADSVREGQPARFRVSSDVAVPIDHPVTVDIDATGDYGVTDGQQTVTILAGQTQAVLELSTTNDLDKEPDGSVAATIAPGEDRYAVAAAPNHSATVAITDTEHEHGLRIWQAELIVGDSHHGYIADTAGTLTPATFVYGGRDYTTDTLRVNDFNGSLQWSTIGGRVDGQGPELKTAHLGQDRFVLEVGPITREFNGNSGGAGFVKRIYNIGTGIPAGTLTGAVPVGLFLLNQPPAFDDGDTATRQFAEHAGSATDAIAVGDPVAATDGNGPNARQTLTYRLGGTDAASFTIDSATGQISTKSGVNFDYEAGTTSYSVTLTVNDGSGVSNDRDSIGVTINLDDVNEPPLAPAAPVVAAVPGQADRLRVTWTAPDNTGRPDITHYDLRHRAQGSGDSGWTNGPQDVSGLSATITGLTQATTYDVQVRAVNAEGDGAWSPSASASTVAEGSPAPVGAIPNIWVANGASQTVDVASYFAGDNITYTAESTDDALAAVAVDGSMVTVTGGATGHGEPVVTVTATNTLGSAPSNFVARVGDLVPDQFDLRDIESETPGESIRAKARIGDDGAYTDDLQPTGFNVPLPITVTVTPGTATVDWSVVDLGNDATTHNGSGTALIEPGWRVHVFADSPARGASLTVTVAIGVGDNVVSANWVVTTKHVAPTTQGTIPAASVAVGAAHEVDASSYFTGMGLSYNAVSSDETKATVAVNNSTVTVTGVAVGTANITVTAANTGGSVTQTFGVTVAAATPPPTATGTIPAVAVTVGASEDVDVASSFSGTVDSYSAVSSDETKATVAVSSSTVTVTGVAAGTATVTVTASNASGSATQSFDVTVAAPANTPPTAGIASTQATTATAGDTVQLMGEGSDAETDDADLTFAWTQTVGPTVTINNSAAATASFTAPDVNADTDLTFRLTVTDADSASATADVTITVSPAPTDRTELWRGMMTVGEVLSGSEWGFQASPSKGSLSSTEFTYNSIDYDVQKVSRTFYGGAKTANFHPGADLGAGVFILKLGDIELTFGPGHSYPTGDPTIFAGTPATYWFRSHVPNVVTLDFDTNDVVQVILYEGV